MDRRNLHNEGIRNEEQNLADENIKAEVSYKTSVGTEEEKKPSILKMKDEWITHSTVEVKEQILKRNTKKIQDFINSLSVPSWCRGLSIFQKKSADDLQNAIRDDLDQKTVYRTMRCLYSLGLEPLPTKKQLQVILTMSGGSDLALLWFLMEWLYQDSESDTYNINEQLIMSSIAHLDMNITLHELDRILPPGQAPKTELIRKNKKELPGKAKKNIKYRKENVLPYFQKLPEPKPRRTNYLGTQKERIAILEPYQHEIKNYLSATENEHRRWFQDYENDNRNPCEKLCNNFNVNTIDDAETATLPNSDHENINCRRNSFVTLLESIDNEKLERNHKPFVKCLLCGTEKPCSEFYATTENCRKRNTGKVLANDAKYRLDAIKTVIKSSSEPQICKKNDCASDNVLLLKESSSSPDTDLCFLVQKSGSVDFLDTNHSKTTLFCETSIKPKYFEMCQGPLPFKFDYKNIYNIKHNNDNDNDKRNNLKHESAFSNALDNELTLQNCLQNISEAASDCNDLVKDSIRKIYHEESKTHENIKIEEEKIEKEVVNYGLDYYDPDDDKLMDRMLEDAFDIMKKDHKFVFASIPAAHRYPLVREWIRLRYGKTYSQKTLTKSFQKSLPIFEALTKVGLPMELPSSADIGKYLITNYSCRDYILQKSHHMRNEYYKRINRALLAQSRVVFFAMCPFQFCSGPLNDTIFAYTPAHKRDCYHFRPWKLEECRNQKEPNIKQF